MLKKKRLYIPRLLTVKIILSFHTRWECFIATRVLIVLKEVVLRSKKPLFLRIVCLFLLVSILETIVQLEEGISRRYMMVSESRAVRA